MCQSDSARTSLDPIKIPVLLKNCTHKCNSYDHKTLMSHCLGQNPRCTIYKLCDLAKSFKFSVLYYPYFQNRDNKSICLMEFSKD